MRRKKKKMTSEHVISRETYLGKKEKMMLSKGRRRKGRSEATSLIKINLHLIKSKKGSFARRTKFGTEKGNLMEIKHFG